jgi:hypothetical protein
MQAPKLHDDHNFLFFIRKKWYAGPWPLGISALTFGWINDKGRKIYP